MSARFLFWTFLGAYALRFLAILLLGSDEVYDNYLGIARQLVNGNGYIADIGLDPNMRRPPVYTGFLTGLILLIGDHPRVFLAIQAIVSACTCLLVACLGRQLVNERVGRIAGILWAIYPLSIWYGTILASETIFTFLLALLLVTVTPLFQKTSVSIGRVLGVGIITGLLALTRPSAQAYPFLLAGLCFLSSRTKRSLGYGFLIVLTSALVVLPWTIRNHKVSGEWIPVAVGIGQSSYEGIYLGPKTEGGPNLFRWDHDPEREEHRWQCLYRLNRMGGTEAVDYDRSLRSKVLEKVKAEPFTVLKHATVRFFAAFFLNNSPTPGRLATLFAIQLPFLVLGAFSLFHAVRRRSWWPSLLLFSFAWLLCVAVIARIRLTYPVMMIVMVLAAWTIHRWLEKRAGESPEGFSAHNDH